MALSLWGRKFLDSTQLLGTMLTEEGLIKLFYLNNLITQSSPCVEHTAHSFSLSISSCLFCGVVLRSGTFVPAAPLCVSPVFACRDPAGSY